MGQVIIRSYAPKDRDAVRRICYATALMGQPIDSQYADFESFADIFTSYYTDAEPERAVVAELDGKILGYILACLDSAKAWNPNWVAFKHVVRRGVCFRPGTAGFWMRGWRDSVADLGQPSRPKVDPARWPSHLHVSLLPEARGASIGPEFFFRAFDKLKLAGSTGLFSETMADNQRMIEIGTKKLGYEPLGEPFPVPAIRTEDGRRTWVRIFTRDLTNWDPSAWRSKARAVHMD